MFSKLFKKNNAAEEKTYDYTPSKDWMAEIRKRETAEKKRKEKWSKELKQKMNSNYTYSTSIGHLPGSVAQKMTTVNSGTITSNNISNSAITINGDPTNGSVKIDVPLLVNGRDVLKELDEMRDVMLLLKRDVDMEAKYPRLKEIKDEYEAALAKYTTFDTLKESK